MVADGAAPDDGGAAATVFSRSPARTRASSRSGRGEIGAGAGATIGKFGGGRPMKAGIGSAAIRLPDGLIVAAIVAVNAIGDVIDPATGRVVAGVRGTDGRLADARRHADRNGGCGDVGGHDGPGADNRPVADRDAVEHLGAGTQPRTLADPHARRPPRLLDDRPGRVLPVVIAADDITVRRQQRPRADLDARATSP